MNPFPKKIRKLITCVGFSALVHILLFFPLGKLGSYSFARPVNQLQAVMVDLKQPGVEAVKGSMEQETSDTAKAEGAAKHDEVQGTAEGVTRGTPASGAKEPQSGPAQVRDGAATNSGIADAATQNKAATNETLPAASVKTVPVYAIKPPLRSADEFLATQHEKLTYRISLLGVPAGSAELEAKNDKGEVRISLRVRSDSTISTIYPVDDVIETRHIGGNFIITKIRQHEGAFRSNTGFTIFLRDKYVFWINLLKNRSSREPMPNSEVLDILSGLYYLRNRPLMVGTTEMLHVYDGNRYEAVPVEVLREEMVRLPNLTKVNAMVIRPMQKSGGMFRNTGDMLIWLTNDKNRVPVKIETSIPLGKVTAELISAESQQYGSLPTNVAAKENEQR